MRDMGSRLHVPYPVLFLVFLTLRPPAFISLFNRWHTRDLSGHSVFADAKLVNVTVDDSSSEIVYSPAGSWHSSTNPCSTCLAPSVDLAFQGTWHDGTHVIPTVDADDLTTGNDPQSTTAVASQNANTNDDDDDDDDKNNNRHGTGGGNDKNKGKGKRERRVSRWRNKRGRWFRRQGPNSNPFFIPKLDSDDDGFVDTPVFAQFNFTGSAVYVYAMVPLFPAAANNTPTFVNLTYTLDSQPAGTYSHSGTQNSVSPTPAPSAFAQTVPVFARSGLPEGSHSLTINVGPDSVLLLDYILYSQDDGFSDGNGTDNAVSTTWSAPGSSVTGTPSGAATQSDDTKKHNVATFAGAVGGSVGLLAVLALSLALSLYRRRRAALRRDRRYRAARTRSSNASIGESFHTDASEDGPPMAGPAPFVPRYFPGTVPTAPPPYIPSHSPGPTDALLAPSPTIHSPLASVSWNTYRPGSASDAGDTSYADRPPPTPPPLDDGIYAPPPTFGEALASPIPAILARLSGMPIPSQSTSPSPVSPPPLQAPPSRRPSRSSMVASSSNEVPSNQDTTASPAHTRGLSSQGSNSSLRGGPSSSTSAAAQSLLTQTPLQIDSLLSEGVVDRPSTSHSQRPPSIPPLIEAPPAEQDTRRTDDNLASR